MPKGFQKFCVFFLILALNGSVFLGVGETHAYFSDTAKVAGNTFSTGTLKFSLSASDWQKNDSEQTKTITIENEGTLDFQHDLVINITSGDDGCKDLKFKASFGGFEKYSNSLEGFKLENTESLASDQDKDWLFTVSEEYENLNCELEFVFRAWQEDLDWQQGFWDEEKHENHLEIIISEQQITDNGQHITDNQQQIEGDEDDVDDDDFPVSNEGDLEEEGIDEGGDADIDADIDADADNGIADNSDGDDPEEDGDTEGGEEEENDESDDADNDNDDNNDWDTEDNSNVDNDTVDNGDNDSDDSADPCDDAEQADTPADLDDDLDGGDEDDVVVDDDDEDNGDDNDDSDNNDE